MAKKKIYKKRGKKVGKDFAKKVRKVIHAHEKETVELKQYLVGEFVDEDVYAATTFTASGPGYYLGNLIRVPQGVQAAQRVGDTLLIKKIKINARVGLFANAGANQFCTHRIMVFQYKASNSAATPNIDDMMVAANVGGVGIHSTFDHRNNDYTTVYNILYDRMITVCNNNSGTAQSVPDNISKFVRIDIPMKYVHKKLKFENTTTDADYPIYICCCTDIPLNGVLPNNLNGKFCYTSSLWYTDS